MSPRERKWKGERERVRGSDRRIEQIRQQWSWWAVVASTCRQICIPRPDNSSNSNSLLHNRWSARARAHTHTNTRSLWIDSIEWGLLTLQSLAVPRCMFVWLVIERTFFIGLPQYRKGIEVCLWVCVNVQNESMSTVFRFVKLHSLGYFSSHHEHTTSTITAIPRNVRTIRLWPKSVRDSFCTLAQTKARTLART